MPTVPTTFVPQVAPPQGGDIGQFQAPGVQPMQNLAGEQVERLGRAMTGIGNVAYRAGSAIQDQLDEAAAKGADVAGQRNADAIYQNYMSLEGKAAEDAYQDAMDGLSAAFAAPMDGLQNDVQKAMYQQAAARNMMARQSQMTAHRLRETKRYYANESAARSDAYANNAVMSYSVRDELGTDGRKIGLVRYEADLGIAMQEARKAAAAQGVPADSAQMQAIERNIMDKVAEGVVNNLMREGNYAEAQTYLDDLAKGKVGEKVYDSLSTSLEANRQRVAVEQLTASIRTDGYPHAAVDPKSYPEREGPSEPPADLRAALEKANEIGDLEVRKMVQSNLRTQYAQEEALANQEYGRLYDEEANRVAQGMRPSEAFGRLNPRDRQSLMNQMVGREQDRIKAADAQLEAEITFNPSALTPQLLQERRGQISVGMYAKLSKALQQPETEQKILESTLDEDQVKQTLVDAGLRAIAYPDRKDEDEVDTGLRFRENVTSMVDAEQRRLNRKLSRDEKQTIIDRAIVQQATIKKPGMIYGYNEITKPMATMTPEEMAMKFERFVQMEDITIPQDEYVRAINALEGVGIAVPTNRQIKAYIMRSRAK